MRWLAGLLILISGSWWTQAGAASKNSKECESILTGDQSLAYSLLLELYELRQKTDQRLYPFSDPLANAVTQEEAHQIVEFLSRDESGQRLSPLGEARTLMHLANGFDVARVLKLAKTLSTQAQELLSQRRIVEGDYLEDLQRVKLGTEVTLSLLHRLVPATLPDQAQNKNSSQSQNQDPRQQQSATSELGQQVPPSYPQAIGEDYMVHTKNTDRQAGGTQESFVAVEINKPDLYFLKTNDFNSARLSDGAIVLESTPLPLLAKMQQRPPRLGGLQATFHVQGQTDAVLLIPPGYEPHQPEPSTKATVVQTSSGQFRLKNPQALDRISLSLSIADQELNPLQAEILQAKILGVRPEQWPDIFRDELFPLLNPALAKESMRKVESFVAHKFLYSVGARRETHPFEAIKAGAFQCDMAATIGLLVAREILGLPARIAGGFKTHKPVSDPKKTVLRLPTEAHAVLEVYIQGKWELFDLTPRRRDRQNQNQETDPNYSETQKNIDSTFAKDEQQKEKTESQKEKEQPKEKQKEERKDQGKKKDTAKDDADVDALDERLEKELEDALSLGSLSLKAERIDGALTARVRRVLFRDALDPLNNSASSFKKLTALKTEIRDEREYKKLVNLAEIALSDAQGALPDAFVNIAANLNQTPLVDSFRRLVQIEDRLALAIHLADSAEAEKLRPHLKRIRDFKKEFSRLNSHRKMAVATAEKFLSGLPPHTRRIVRDTYKVQDLNPTPEVKALVKDIESGRLNDFNLLRLLYPLTNFVMDSTPSPALRTQKTLFEDSRRTRGRDWVGLDDMTRSREADLEEPHNSVYYNIRQGLARVQSRKRTVEIPSPIGKSVPKRVTIVNYDTSGSMSGAPGDFQAGLIAAFVDRALSDMGPGGRHNHTCALLGFDDKVNKVTMIKDSEDAYRVIRGFRKEMANTAGGTDIMAALEESFAQIYSAQKANNNEPLASANIILMSDGKSQIDYTRLTHLMSKVHRKTPVKFMFVAINGENEQLYDLAMQSRQIGAQSGFYHSFPAEKITGFLNESKRAPQADPERELYTESKPSDLAADLGQRLALAGTVLNQDLQSMRVKNLPREAKVWSSQIELIQDSLLVQKESRLGAELRRFRGILERSKLLEQDPRLVTVITDDIFKSFPKITGKSFQQLDILELGHIRHLLSWAISKERPN